MTIAPLTLRFTTAEVPADLTTTELALYGNGDHVRLAVRTAIRRFVIANAENLRGRVLDYGAGKVDTCAVPQPYRYLLPTGGGYYPWEPGDPDPATAGPYDAILCTQVAQNFEDPVAQAVQFRALLRPGGLLVMTYPVAWEEIENEYWRITKKGAWLMCHKAGFQVVTNETIAGVQLDGCLTVSLVNGLVARRPQ